jgi:hypothetical protein
LTNESDDGPPPRIADSTVDNDQPEEFPAVFGCYKGECRTDIGWLTGQTEIQLRFHSNALQIWSSKLRNSKISLKVAPIGMLVLFLKSISIQWNYRFKLSTRK